MCSARHPKPAGGATSRPRAWLAALLLAWIVAPAAHAGIAACDAPEHAVALQASTTAAALDARAYWLDRRLLRWPGAPVDGRYRLYAAARPTLVAEPGTRVRGFDRAFALAHERAPLPPALAERFRFVGAGATLRLDADDAALRALHRDALLLTREDAHGRVLETTRLQHPGALDDLYAAAEALDDYGATPDATSTRFRVWAPTARSVALCLYPDAEAGAERHVPMRFDATTGTWSLVLSQDLSGRYYTYLVDVHVPGTGLVRNRVTDPYSVGLNADSRRSYVADLDHDALKPAGWDTAPRPPALAAMTDLAVYELHVRDFSREDPGVPAAHRGKYLGFTHAGSAGVRHLRALAEAGITDVHLLPVFDIATVPERGCVDPAIPDAAPDSEAQQAAVAAVKARDCFNWGYDPYHFNAPEGSYATDANDGAARIREFRAMVMALHAAGLRVGMDVVYNHTTTSGQAPTSVLDRIVPGYYHRLDAKGAVERSTCCENTATEHRMMAKLMIDSAVLWARHYRIDSFRFDLMGHQPREAMERLQRAVDAAAGRPIPLIGEGWNFGEVADGARFVQASQRSLAGAGIGTFSDRARDAIRGGGPVDHGEAMLARKGYVNGMFESDANGDAALRERQLRAADMVRVGLAGSLRDYRMTAHDGHERALAGLDYNGQPAGYVAQPGEVVNYVENHDNQTLFDINVYKLPPATTREDRARVQLLAFALNAFSQGIAYFHAGGELLRSKSLDRNSFDSGDWFNALDWSGRDNGFARGLPPEEGNGRDWPLMRPLLADAAIKPDPAEIAFARDAFLDLLRIRSSSTLLRLRTAQDVHARLRFPNTGPAQNPAVIVGHLDGDGYSGARFAELVYLVNVAPTAQTLVLPELRGKPLVLHPVHRAPDAADRRARKARFQSATGTVHVPARTAVVFVVETP
ncbi:MAG TPA: alpha-1,6-glucosidase domain-containing protein [Lysobacter sp.]|nr:alpha-1,6-glucosidase domain-containing protein [Lysobacter sp.]